MSTSIWSGKLLWTVQHLKMEMHLLCHTVKQIEKSVCEISGVKHTANMVLCAWFVPVPRTYLFLYKFIDMVLVFDNSHCQLWAPVLSCYTCQVKRFSFKCYKLTLCDWRVQICFLKHRDPLYLGLLLAVCSKMFQVPVTVWLLNTQQSQSFKSKCSQQSSLILSGHRLIHLLHCCVDWRHKNHHSHTFKAYWISQKVGIHARIFLKTVLIR